METNWQERISGENLLVRPKSSTGIFFNINVGDYGKSRVNCEYILREGAVDSTNKFNSIYLQNFGRELFYLGMSYKEATDRIRELVGQIEDEEMLFKLRGHRTFYRVLISFGSKVKTEVARDLVAKYFQKYFPLYYLVGAVHQNTPYTHVHVNLLARNIKGKKLTLDNQIYRSLDILWGEIFAEHFGKQYLETHLEKKRETREYKRALARGENRERPERYRVTTKDFEERDRRRIGYEKIRDYGDQREIAIESERIGEQAVEIATREIESSQQAIEQRGQERIREKEPIVDRAIEQEHRIKQFLTKTIELDTRTVSTIRELREGVVPTVQRTDSRFERTDQQTRDSIAEIGRTDSRLERTNQYTREAASGIERTTDSGKQIERDIATSTSRAREIDGTVREEYSRVDRTSECCRQIERGIDGLTERTRELVITRQREYQLSREIERDYPRR